MNFIPNGIKWGGENLSKKPNDRKTRKEKLLMTEKQLDEILHRIERMELFAHKLSVESAALREALIDAEVAIGKVFYGGVSE